MSDWSTEEDGGVEETSPLLPVNKDLSLSECNFYFHALHLRLTVLAVPGEAVNRRLPEFCELEAG